MLTLSTLTVTEIHRAIHRGDVHAACSLADQALSMLRMGWELPEGWTLTMFRAFLQAAPSGALVARRVASL